MSTETLKDSAGRLIGYIETRPDGTQVGKDHALRLKGYYDPKMNTTKDPALRVVGHGNLLAMLITRP